jgi:hypothetical protein
MALQIQVSTTSGLELPEAYIKIVGFSGDITNTHLNYQIFVNAQARASGKVPVDTGYALVPSPSGIVGKDIMAWGYAKLKSLPKFTNALDL